MRTKKYEVMAMLGYDNYKIFRTNSIHTAIKKWTRWDNKYPTSVGLWATEYDAKLLIEYCIENPDWVEATMYDLYTERVVDVFSVTRAVNLSHLASKNLDECSTEERSVDEVYPFSRG